MLGLLRRITLERAIQLAIASTIVTTLLAAGSLRSWIEPARTLRWLALLALAVLAATFAARRRRDFRFGPTFAIAAAFVAVAFASALWSAAPRLTLGRASAFALVLLTATALASVATRATVERIVEGVLLGAAAVAVGGLLVLAFRYDRAVQAATTVSPARYQGLGGGPNMAPMVFAIATPLALNLSVVSRHRWSRAAGIGAVALFLGSIAFSGSRGAFAASFIGLAVYPLLIGSGRRRVLVGAASAALAAATLAFAAIPSKAATSPPEPTGQDPMPAEVTPAPGYLDANRQGLRLQDDVGHPGQGVPAPRLERTLTGTGSSGRTEAWRGALGLVADRPVVGYGFGTEDRTFVDRYVFFNSSNPENSYVGLLLQLGAVGFLLLLVLLTLLLRSAVAGASPLVAATTAAFCAALVLGLVQSYLYAAGNAATAAAWLCGFGALAAARSRR